MIIAAFIHAIACFLIGGFLQSILRILAKGRFLCGDTPLLDFALALPLGQSLVYWLSLTMLMFDLGNHLILVFAVLTLISCIGIVMLRKEHLRITEWQLILILPTFIYPFVYCYYTPVFGDALNIWFFHGKILFESMMIPSEFMKSPVYAQFSHMDYPLFFPILSVLQAKLIGSWDFVSCRGFLFFNFVTYVLGFHAILPKTIPKILSLCISGFLAIYIQDPAVNGYMDVHVAMFFFFGALCVIMGWQRNNLYQYLIGIILVVSATQIKNEGLAYGSIFLSSMVAVIFFTKNELVNKGRWLLILCLAIGFSLIWKIYAMRQGLDNDLFAEGFYATNYRNHEGFMFRIVMILAYFLRFFVDSAPNAFLTIFFLVILGWRIKSGQKPAVKVDWPILMVTSIMAIFAGVYFITPWPVVDHLKSSFRRIFLVIIPFLIYWLSTVAPFESDSSEKV